MKGHSHTLLGSDTRPEARGMAEALRALDLPERSPTELDAPPPSTFPRTPAAREALRLGRKDKPS